MRITKENVTYRMVYGIDHIEGNFIILVQKGKKPLFEDSLLFEMKNISVARLISIAEEYGFNMEAEKDGGDGFSIPSEIGMDLAEPGSVDATVLSGSGCGGGCETCARMGI